MSEWKFIFENKRKTIHSVANKLIIYYATRVALSGVEVHVFVSVWVKLLDSSVFISRMGPE